MYNSLFAHYGLGIDFEDEDPCDVGSCFSLVRRKSTTTGFGPSEIHPSIARNDLVQRRVCLQWPEEIELTSSKTTTMRPIRSSMEFASEAGHITDAINLSPALGADFTVAETYPPRTHGLSRWIILEHSIRMARLVDMLDTWNSLAFLENGSIPKWELRVHLRFRVQLQSRGTVDDGSCEVTTCAGCTWPEARNYDRTHCGTTFLSNSGIVSCPEDINRDGQVNTRPPDVLRCFRPHLSLINGMHEAGTVCR